jgi:hypothetical protein
MKTPARAVPLTKCLAPPRVAACDTTLFLLLFFTLHTNGWAEHPIMHLLQNTFAPAVENARAHCILLHLMQTTVTY